MDVDFLRTIGEIGGVAIGVLSGLGLGASRANNVIKVIVDAVNQLDVVIGKDKQSQVKRAIYNESLKRGLHEKVSMAVKKAESKDA